MRRQVAPKEGDWRTVTRFLFLPTVFSVGPKGPFEWRWLERARICQKFVDGIFGPHWLSLHWDEEV